MYNRGEKEMRWSKANDGIKLSSTNDTQNFLHDVFSERKDKKKGKLSNANTRTQNGWYYDDVGALGFKMYAWELPLISNLSFCFKKTKKVLLFSFVKTWSWSAWRYWYCLFLCIPPSTAKSAISAALQWKKTKKTKEFVET